MTEALFQAIWQHRLFSPLGLKTTEGHTVEVLSPGLLNQGAGPDFAQARLRIGGQELLGAVELHLEESGWFQHGHHLDPNYNPVVLHVLAEEPLPARQSAFTAEGRRPSTLVLGPHILSEALDAAEKLQNHAFGHRPCAKWEGLIPKSITQSALDAYGVERLVAKADRAADLVKSLKGDWQQANFVLLAVTLLGKTNADPAQRLAASLPLTLLSKHQSPTNLLQIEAILFGVAGLLPVEVTDSYEESLCSEWQFLRHKYQLSSLDNLYWQYGRMRPPSFPPYRLAQLATVFANGLPSFEDLLPPNSAQSVKQRLFEARLEVSPYWERRFKFGPEAKSATSRELSQDLRQLILINVTAPMAYAYGEAKRRPELGYEAINLLESLPPEKNHVTKALTPILGKPLNALQSQSMLRIDGSYCAPRQCLGCRIGQGILREGRLWSRQEEAVIV